MNDLSTKGDFLRKPRKTSAYKDSFGSSPMKLSSAAGNGNLHQYARSKQGVETNSRFLEPENHQFSLAHQAPARANYMSKNLSAVNRLEEIKAKLEDTK